MSGACSNSWPPYGCEWSIGYLWHSMSLLRRLDLILLALMLAYVVVVFVRVSYSFRIARQTREFETDERSLRKLLADLGIHVANLKSIASIAPYLGLVGTCIGIFDGFRGVGTQAESGLAAIILTGVVPIALITTIGGLLVAIPATWSYNALCTCLDLLECETSRDTPVRRRRHSRFAQKFPLAARSSTIAFPLIATPTLAILVGLVFMEYASHKTPTGLGVELAPARCEFDGDDRPIVLRVANSRELSINGERADWKTLSEHLSRIYALGKYPVLYLLVEDDVPFQAVADAIDVIDNVPLDSSDSRGIRVRLVTPATMKMRCLEPVAIRSVRHVQK